MNRFSPVTSKLTHILYSDLGSNRLSQTRLDEEKIVSPPIIGQAVCIEAAVAFTLVFYIGWICLRGWYFEVPIITSEQMTMLSILILVAALGAKLFWVVWSTIDRRLKN